MSVLRSGADGVSPQAARPDLAVVGRAIGSNLFCFASVECNWPFDLIRPIKLAFPLNPPNVNPQNPAIHP
jgi:hypothetical protein